MAGESKRAYRERLDSVAHKLQKAAQSHAAASTAVEYSLRYCDHAIAAAIGSKSYTVRTCPHAKARVVRAQAAAAVCGDALCDDKDAIDAQ